MEGIWSGGLDKAAFTRHMGVYFTWAAVLLSITLGQDITQTSLARVQEYNETRLRDISSGMSFKVEKLEMGRLSSYSGVFMKTFWNLINQEDPDC